MLTLLRGATVYAPAPLGRMDVLVAGGRIAAVAPDLPHPAAGWPCEVVELAGRILAPGLVDTHTHLAGGGGEGGAHTRVPPVALSALTTAGVTTAIGLLGTDGSTRTIAESLACARGLEALGITCYSYTGSYELPLVTLTGTARGDLVHVDRIVAIGELALSDHRSSQPSFEELVRVASDAHVAGMMTGKAGLLHLHMGDGPRGLAPVRRALDETELPPRVFHPTHCNRNPRLWAEAKELSRRGCSIDITAFPDDDTAADCLVEWADERLDPDRITMSSDGGGCLPTFDRDGVLLGMDVGASRTLLGTIRAARDRGLPLEAGLAACTRNPAALFRLHAKGRIDPGADADLLVLRDDLGVDAVMARGRWLVREGSAVVRGHFEG